jgi:hypothetical protein
MIIRVNFKILVGVVCYALVWAVWDLSTACMFVAGWAANDLAGHWPHDTLSEVRNRE